MAYGRARPNSNGPYQQHFNSIYDRLDDLEKKTGRQATSSDRQSPVFAPPKFAKLSVTSPQAGLFVIHVTNPEAQAMTAVNQAAQRNQVHVPIMHIIESSLNAAFDGNGAVDSIGPTPQTYFEIAKFGAVKRFWRIRSTFDGHTYNQSMSIGAVQS